MRKSIKITCGVSLQPYNKVKRSSTQNDTRPPETNGGKPREKRAIWISMVKPTRRTNISHLLYLGVTLYMFRTVFPPIIRSSRLYIQQPNRYWCLLASNQTAVSVWHTLVAVCTVLNCWWWAERPSETCRVLLQKNKFETLVHLVGFYYGNILRCAALWTSNAVWN